MRKFAFRGERILQWRQLEARIEEGKLERMRGELRAIDHQRAELQRSLADAERVVSGERLGPGSAGISGLELAALTAFRRHVAAQHARLAAARAECLHRLETQTAALARKRRDVTLIEKLKERKWASWTAEMDREIGQQAEDTYVAKARTQRRRGG